MTISREAFIEMVAAIISGIAEQKIPLGGACHLLYALAQPTVEEERIDVTDEVLAKLPDWNEYNKGQLLSVEVLHLHFPCSTLGAHEGDHEGCEKKRHTCQMTRVSGAPGWRPTKVASEFNFDDAVVATSMPYHPEYDPNDPDNGGLNVAGSPDGTLEGAFKRLFGGAKIDKEVADFRAELDALFPSPPVPGKEETE